MDHDDYEFEKTYWGDCCNTFDEDQKHYVYAHLMGIPIEHFSLRVHNASILDIGGGPSSMLLKCKDLRSGKVVDPIEYPKWTRDRYHYKNISVDQIPAEELTDKNKWDEVWIYNCLQHTIDPALIIHNAKCAAPVLRIFEWIDVPAHDGHPHELTKDKLDLWIGYSGGTVSLAQQGCFGVAYYGAFKYEC